MAPASGNAENAPKSLAREAASPALPAVATPRTAPWTVRGTCVGADGAALADVRLALAPSSPEGGFANSQSVVGQSAADGRFELSIPDATGEWAVEFGRGGHAIVRRVGLAAVSGQVVELGNVALVGGRSLVVVASNAEGQPLGARTVRLRRQSRPPHIGRAAWEVADVS
ncbi:MAG: hypothetical protein FJ306_02785, partial [Planctomycetes bacterium]|nr:hypothetical protein [Planctomycetota bacterium]